MENRADYTTDTPHAHSLDDDTGVPFWKRAAVTEGQYAALLRELREVKEKSWQFQNLLQQILSVYDNATAPDLHHHMCHRVLKGGICSCGADDIIASAREISEYQHEEM